MNRTKEQREELFQLNLGLAKALVGKRHKALNMEYDDALQVAYIGLWNATDTWDENKGAFSTHATYTIQGEFTREVRRLTFGSTFGANTI